jgi:RNA 2',3'-cyclic 3'-phosphodiesterase
VRTFVAIDVGPPLDPSRRGRTEAPDHMTLRFLGEVAEDRIGPIGDALRAAVAPIPPFDLTLEGVGAFPAPDRPRVVWIGATEGRGRAEELARATAGALDGLGFPREAEAFVPHVTLFRVRSPRDRSRAARLLDGTEPTPSPRTVRVTEVLLKGSELTHSGAVHRILERAPLAGPTGPLD